MILMFRLSQHCKTSQKSRKKQRNHFSLILLYISAIMTNLDVLNVMGQQGNTVNVDLSNTEVCQSKPIPLLISSQNIGAQLEITLASVSAVGVDSRMYFLQIPGVLYLKLVK